MPRMPRWAVSLVTACLLALASMSCMDGEPPPGDFHAGPVGKFELTSITTFTDGDVVERAAPPGATATHMLDGTLVFHLVRLESGDFIALSARGSHSECWVPWEPEFEFEGRTGWFRDPCDGSTYDEEGVRVAGPAPRDLDRYPVEVRESHVYVNVAETALTEGVTRVEAVHPDTTPLAEASPRPTAAMPGPTPAVATTATPEATAGATLTPPTAAEGTPFGGEDLVGALGEEGLGYGPQDDGIGCEGAGARGDAYGTASHDGDPAWPGFTLWVYPSSEALRADWDLPATGPPRTKLDDCPLDGSTFWNQNLLLMLGDPLRWSDHGALREQIIDAFLALGGTEP